ncbi:MAG: hypothetical protein A6F72_05585 [Cycloclasticus sp. symbiont of Poecilosclerida sp. N]|nr:MAG: hypothetical protein A6F72_05585 [Cycloclasticus sp. symbiont of Poecilosclerida sp. N]
MSELVKISDIFDIEYGNSLELISLLETKSTNHNAIPFISRTENNNGASAFVEKELDIKLNSKHTLSVALGGSVLSTFYQPIEYYTGFHIFVLTPRKQLSIIEMLYYAKCISSNKYKYSYGRQANKTLKDVLIPAKISKNIKVNLTNFYQKSLINISNKSVNNSNQNLRIDNWADFKLTDIFDIKKGERLTTYDRIKSDKNIPLITASSENNGVIDFISYSDFQFEKNIFKNKITIDMFCNVFYHDYQYFSDDNVHTLIPKLKINNYASLFIVSVLKKTTNKYSYGRQARIHRLEKEIIKLPTKNNQPDWQFMEDYIKSLPYSKSL